MNDDKEKVDDKDKATKDKPNLAIIIGMCCAVLTVVQGLCSLYHIEVAMNVLIDIVSLALTALVGFKVIQSDKTGSARDIMEDIKKDIMGNMESNSATEHDAIIAVSKTTRKSKSKSPENAKANENCTSSHSKRPRKESLVDISSSEEKSVE